MDASARRRRLGWLLIALALVAGLWLRARHLTLHPFWLDEAYSAFAADKGYRFIWTVLPGYETHPPFYSAALRTWTLIAGDSLGAYRSLGVLIGMLILPVVWLAGREMERGLGRKPWTIAIPAILLVAVLPSLVDTARLVRPYYLLTFVNAVGIWSVLRLARVHRETGMLDDLAWRTYLATLALLFWLHNLGALYVAGMGLGLLILIGPVELLRHHARRVLVGHALVAAIALPALLILVDQASAWTHSTWLTFNGNALFDNILLIFGLPGLFGLAVALLLAGLTLGNAGRSRMPLALLAIAVTPMLLALVLTFTVAPVFLPRTLVASGIPLVMLVAASADHSALLRVAFAMLLVLAFERVVQVEQLPPEQNWYGAVRWLTPRLAPGDRIYAYPNEGALPLRYALRDLEQTASIRQIPSEVPARDPSGWYPTGSRGVQSLPTARLTEIANDPVSRATPTIWLLRLGPNAYDKEDDFLHILARTRTPVARFTDRDIDIVGLRSAQPATPEQAKP